MVWLSYQLPQKRTKLKLGVQQYKKFKPAHANYHKIEILFAST